MNNDDNTLIKSKYNDIKKRHFNQILILFVYEQIKDLARKVNNVQLNEINASINKKCHSYIPTETLIQEYNNFTKSRKNRNITDYINENINTIYKTVLGGQKLRIGIKKLKRIFNNSYKTAFMEISTFEKAYGLNRKCGYCGISEKQINILIDQNKIFTKRLVTRGRRMEIDKIKAEGFYEEDNIILSCYWCNNAKTDEFTLNEFKEIARGINKTFEFRIKEKIQFPNYCEYNV